MFRDLLSNLEGSSITVFLSNNTKLEGVVISTHKDCFILSGKTEEDKRNIILYGAVVSISSY